MENVLEYFKFNYKPASDVKPPRGPSGIGRAAMLNDTSRSRLLWSLSVSKSFSSSNVSMTGGGCRKIYSYGQNNFELNSLTSGCLIGSFGAKN